MSSEDSLIEFKVVLVGASGVGKSCIAQRGTSGVYDGSTQPTLGASYTAKSIVINKRLVRLLIWDTAGQERYRGITPMYYRNSAAAVIIYSIAERSTFLDADAWIESLRDKLPSDALLYLVGNKSDLEDQREVTPDEGQDKAAAMNATFYEVSAKTGAGINDLLVLMASTCLDAHGGRVRLGSQDEEKTIDVGNKAEEPQNECC
jgi:small GTP-binding protein